MLFKITNASLVFGVNTKSIKFKLVLLREDYNGDVILKLKNSPVLKHKNIKVTCTCSVFKFLAIIYITTHIVV